jgi:hypothetical protein
MSYDDEEPISEKLERATDILFDLIEEYDSKNGTDYGMPTTLKKENLPLYEELSKQAYSRVGLDWEQYKPKPKTSVYKNFDNISYNIDGNKFDFLFNNDNTANVNLTDVEIESNFCTGPLAVYNNLFKTYDRSCFFIYTNVTTNKKQLIGYTKYKILDNGANNLNFYLSLYCVPPKFSGKGITFIMNYVILKEAEKQYGNQIKTISIDEIAEISKTGQKTNGLISRKLGLESNSSTNFSGPFLNTIGILNRQKPIEAQLQELNSKLMTASGGKGKKQKRTKKNKKIKRRRSYKKRQHI